MIAKILGVIDIFIAVVLLLSITINIATPILFFAFFYLLLKGGISLIG